MIILTEPPVLMPDGTTYLSSTFPGAVGTEELLYFATKRLGLHGEWIENAAKPEERFLIRGRTIKTALAAGARSISAADAVEVLRYKRYLHATSPEDRIERRLVARYVLALVDLGCTDLGLAAEAAADTYSLEPVIAAAEMGEALERFSGGYATWRDETGTAEQCGRCARRWDEPGMFPEGYRGMIEVDVDSFYRCPACVAAVRQEEKRRDIDQRLRALLTGPVM